MQPPPIACRRAVHSLQSYPSQHVWISDELLTLTLRRFFRPACVHQKRHGSNVPGPLEARRRATKRRITAQAHVPQGGPTPPLFSFGALFGVRPSPAPSWKYEPPSLPSTVEPLRSPFDLPSQFSFDAPVPPPPQPPPLPDFFFPPTPIPAPQRVLGEQKDAESSDLAPNFEPLETEDRAAKPQRRYIRLLTYRPLEAHDAVVRLKTLQRFIDSTEHLSDTLRYNALGQFLKRSSYDSTGAFSLIVLRELVQARWSTSVIIARLSEPAVPLPSMRDPEGAGFLRRLHVMCAQKRPRKIGSLYRKLARATIQDPDKRAVNTVFVRFLHRQVWESHTNSPQAMDQELLNGLGKMIHDQRTRLHLESIRIGSSNANESIDRLVRRGSRGHHVSLIGKVFDCLPPSMLRAWVKHVLARILAYGPGNYTLSWRKLMELRRLLALFRALDSRKLHYMNHVPLTILAHDHLAVYGIARRDILQRPSMSTWNRVVGQICSMRQFQYILDAANQAKLLPLAYRSGNAGSLFEARTVIIHQLAYQYSIDISRSHLQNARSIQYLFKYLQGYRLPIGPLFTQSLVRVCITQPLSREIFVSSRVLVNVLRLVARVEGEEVARKIEDQFWTARGVLIRNAKRASDDQGGNGKVRVNTMKDLGLV